MFRALSFSRLVPFLAVAAVCTPTVSVFAQAQADGTRAPGDAQAEDLDRRGMALLKQGKVAEACPHFADSFRIRPGTGVLMRLALCHEQSGKWASAWHAYRDAAARATASGDSAVVPLAQKRAAALEARLSRVILRLDSSSAAAHGVEVTCDGNPLPPNAIGVALELDPGEHVIAASAPGRSPFKQTLRVGETAARHEIAIALPVQQTVADTAPATYAPSAPEHQQPMYWSTQRKAAIVAGGIGIVGVAVGAVFGLKVATKMDQARDRCGGGTTGCPSESLALQDQAQGPARISTAAFTLGVIGIAGGAALWFTAPNTKPESAVGLKVQPLIDHNSGVVSMSGYW
ncbi:MAG TPA: tetratricopeptide repeat protein [Polyangiaceae bacterium]|nr:tetratricopeptide repeat protein [Polyangiaceae bacterium]